MLYEEKLYSKWIVALLIPPMIAMPVGLYESLVAGQGVAVMALATVLTIVIVLDLMAIRVRVYEDRIFITGFLGLFVRKTVRVEEIEWFAVREGWTGCQSMMHFTLPARACVYLKRRKGWDVSFSTNRPESLETVLKSLGVPQGV